MNELEARLRETIKGLREQVEDSEIELTSLRKELKGLQPAIDHIKESMASEISELKAELAISKCDNILLKTRSIKHEAEAARTTDRLERMMQALREIDKKVRAPDQEDAPMALVEFEVPRRVDELLKRIKEDKA